MGDPSLDDAGLPAGLEAGVEPFRALLFSRTAGYRHDAIGTAIAAFKDLQGTGGYVVEATEDATQFTVANLGHFQWPASSPWAARANGIGPGGRAST
jgi:hypothetical protein